MEKTLGIDLGTNSIGYALREHENFDWFGVSLFKKGVGEGKTGEYSFAAERTQHRSSRRLYNARRYRKWATLKTLIEHDYCPLSMEELNKWKNYEKGIGRVFPQKNEKFNCWIKLDFTGNGVQDYQSPYQLRKDLINEKFDLTNAEDRYKIGRALYHIAQRRGFKSSRKVGANEKTAVYNGSDKTSTIGLNEYDELIASEGSLGAALASLELNNERIRNRYTLRKHYEEEVDKILDCQNINDEDFVSNIKKAIFFQRPLRGQKGLIGKCTLEPSKARIPISHPLFEKFRAWSFINNIKVRKNNDSEWEDIPLALKQSMFKEKFFLKGNDFKFKQLRIFLEKNGEYNFALYNKSKDDKTINYGDETSVASCPVSARLKEVLGEDWETCEKTITKKVTRKGKTFEKDITYGIDEIWHILFTYEDEEIFREWCTTVLELNEEQESEMMRLWNAFPDGYASLSRKAISNIVPLLTEGLPYTEAVLLGKVAELAGDNAFTAKKEHIIDGLKGTIKDNRNKKQAATICNALISKYYLLADKDKFAWKNFKYKLVESDNKEALEATLKHFGKTRWAEKSEEQQEKILKSVTQEYQSFFEDEKRAYRKLPHLLDEIKAFIADNFEIALEKLDSMYHPSQISVYTPAEKDEEGKFYLESPKTNAFRNPMAMKTLHELRKTINHLIETDKIDEDTRIVVEVARELNDANKRWAINQYQRDRESENKEFAAILAELRTDKEFKGIVNENSKNDIDKFRIWTEQIENSAEVVKEIMGNKDTIKKYRLWKEQNCVCFYSGKHISLTDLFDTNKVDLEHTIARSKSFDNSLANMTVCYADYNRNIKKNLLPTQMPNYQEDTKEGTAIAPRLEDWKKKVAASKKLIENYKAKSKYAQDKEAKDKAIRAKHLASFDYEYWHNKLDRFTRKDVPTGFKNSQLTDTQLISKYAFHYLKTAFRYVDVQKGSNTAVFRKIYEIQEKDEIKDRSKHYHHAIDAAVLTLIPKASQREEMLKKYYQSIENRTATYKEKPFANFHNNLISTISDTILIDLKSKDQALSHAKKRIRKRGKIQYHIDDNGNKVEQWAKGDAIRGALHLDTFYGKIKAVQRNEDGTPIRNEDGTWLYDEKTEGYKFVLRKPIESLSSLKDIVDPHLAQMIEKQLNGRSLAAAIKDGLYFIGKKGDKINKIRRVRCWASVTEPLEIKKQTYLSHHAYKHNYYAANATNYAYLLYEGEVKAKLTRKFELITLFDLAQIMDTTQTEGFTVNKQYEVNAKGETIPLKAVLKPLQRVLFYHEEAEELKNLEAEELSKRLYHIVKFMKDGRITFQHHLEARNDNQLAEDFPSQTFGSKGKNGFSSISTDFIAPKLLLSQGNFKFISENVDFIISALGNIEFID